MLLSYTSDLSESGCAFTFESNSWALDRKCLLTSIEFKFFPCAAPTTPMPQRILILYVGKNIAEHLLNRKIVHPVRGKCSPYVAKIGLQVLLIQSNEKKENILLLVYISRNLFSCRNYFLAIFRKKGLLPFTLYSKVYSR